MNHGLSVLPEPVDAVALQSKVDHAANGRLDRTAPHGLTITAAEEEAQSRAVLLQEGQGRLDVRTVGDSEVFNGVDDLVEIPAQQHR